MGRDSKPRLETCFTALSDRTGAKRLSVLEPTLIIPIYGDFQVCDLHLKIWGLEGEFFHRIHYSMYCFPGVVFILKPFEVEKEEKILSVNLTYLNH